jgi:hypothetical protein
MLDSLTLLVDRVIVVDPTVLNLDSWRYPRGRFQRFAESGIFIPLFSRPSGGKPTYASLFRKEIMKDQFFLGDYSDAVEFDLNDADFCSLVRSKHLDPTEVAFSVNWDLILAQALQAPIVTSRKFIPVIHHKIAETADQFTQYLDMRSRAIVLRRFLSRLNILCPQDLDPDLVIELRKEKAAKGFRTWFCKELERAMIAKRIARVRLDEKVYESFKQLLEEQEHKTSRISNVLTGVFAGIVGLLSQSAGIPAGAAAVPAGAFGALAFPKILTSLWKKVGPRNWLLIMADVSRTRRR